MIEILAFPGLLAASVDAGWLCTAHAASGKTYPIAGFTAWQ
jgi:hypothetical protein